MKEEQKTVVKQILARRVMQKGARHRSPWSLFGLAAALTFGLPSAGLAVVTLSDGPREVSAPAFDLFTPASVDPELAARFAEKARARGVRFTPLGTATAGNDRTVTLAIRIDSDVARSLSGRSAIEAVPGEATQVAGLQTSRFNLGTARGYQSFARTQTADIAPSGRTIVEGGLDPMRADMGMPDLADFAPAQPTREDKPSRLQPRIELEGEQTAGRSRNTLDSVAAQTVDLGGSFRLSPNLDVTAGVRLSQERDRLDRLDPLTNSVKDSQAVYVGTQIRF